MKSVLLSFTSFIWSSPVLAQLPHPDPGTFEPFLWRVVALLAIAALVAHLAVNVKKLFGRTPPLDQVLAGLATVERDIKPLAEQLTKALEKLDAKVDRSEMEESRRDREGIRKELNNRLRTNEEALSNMRHTYATKDDLNTVNLRTEAYRQEIQKFQEGVNSNIRALGERSAAVERDVKNLTRTVGSFDSKLDRLIEAAGEQRGRSQHH